MWVDYSAFDAKATWDLYHSLREKLRGTECHVDGELRAGVTGCAQAAWYTQWDLYQDLVRPFGALLTDLEQVRTLHQRRVWICGLSLTQLLRDSPLRQVQHLCYAQ